MQLHPSTLKIFIQKKNRRNHHTNSWAWDTIRQGRPYQHVERLQSGQRGGRPDHPSPRPWQHVGPRPHHQTRRPPQGQPHYHLLRLHCGEHHLHLMPQHSRSPGHSRPQQDPPTIRISNIS